MRDCTVSVTSPKDGRTHTVEVTASSKLDAAETHTVAVTASSLAAAAAQAIAAWSRLWWWEPDLTLEVKCSDRQWKVSAGWVRAVQARPKG